MVRMYLLCRSNNISFMIFVHHNFYVMEGPVHNNTKLIKKGRLPKQIVSFSGPGPPKGGWVRVFNGSLSFFMNHVFVGEFQFII